MNEFLAQRDDWKAVERDRLEDENRRIAGFAALQAARENDRMEEKRKQDDYRDELIHRVSGRDSGGSGCWARGDATGPVVMLWGQW